MIVSLSHWIIVLLLASSSVNCSNFYFIFGVKKPAEIETTSVKEVEEEAPAVLVPVKPVIVLKESEDEEKSAILSELSALLAKKALRKSQIVPKEFDSMEKISAEDSFTQRWSRSVNDLISGIDWQIFETISGLNLYDDYDNYGDESGIDGEEKETFGIIDSDRSSSSSNSVSSDGELAENSYDGEAADFFYGKQPQQQQKQDIINDDSFQIIDADIDE